MSRVTFTVFALGISSALTGCLATAPQSLLSGIPETRADAQLSPVRILEVDGRSQFEMGLIDIQVEPGIRVLRLASAAGGRAGVVREQNVAFRVEPCTRYALAARRETSMQRDWELVIDRQERVRGCQPDAELQKATKAAQPHTTP
ncbi:hypothetical protein HNQ51_002599 [Inhella inkyongensis]|uniref:Lipoprotein n=1 Tax=Inhella inkyongensis TaxID=392593 RepID=A0A840SA68_9BURK|nr:hypothetical protein [Inhella inkyongensis]MBB5205280.1 hypothetical protein [Inhella inkyongensis]